ncbi:hypothetical protein ACH5RR_018330 [Cinchona calisaya]|uniref:Uncharacterized protein n=1 Tax=Cinchona calisaya TaxID=153742 RepID=A0ABD2ZMT7_9GENT
MNCLSISSWSCSFNSFNSAGAILYGALEIGSASGTNFISNLISRSGGNPGNSSGNTSGNHSGDSSQRVTHVVVNLCIIYSSNSYETMSFQFTPIPPLVLRTILEVSFTDMPNHCLKEEFQPNGITLLSFNYSSIRESAHIPFLLDFYVVKKILANNPKVVTSLYFLFRQLRAPSILHNIY